MSEKVFISGDEAVAIGVKLASPKVIAAYPITPQTIVVERLSEMVESRELESHYMYVESEHSALCAVLGASVMGARTFTATSSQGLLYMAEVMHYASGGRVPLVMMNANRSIALPWSIFGDQRDSLSLLDSGWIQIYAENAQEALDLIIMAYAVAEDERVLTPVMVNLDGFLLTHTYEEVYIPDKSEVEEFLPEYSLKNKLDLNAPKNIFFSSTPRDNMAFKYKQNKAVINSKKVISQVEESFREVFGRNYSGLVEEYKTEGADYVLVTLGSISGTIREVIDSLREKGEKVGLLRIRYMRPFPEDEIISLCERVKYIGVLEKDISFGYEGTVFTNFNSALSKSQSDSKVINFIGGLGGKDISMKDIENCFEELKKLGQGQKIDRVQFINVGVDTSEK